MKIPLHSLEIKKDNFFRKEKRNLIIIFLKQQKSKNPFINYLFVSEIHFWNKKLILKSKEAEFEMAEFEKI